MSTDDSKKDGTPEPRGEPKDGLSRREMLEKARKYSLAVLGIAFGGKLAGGCHDEDSTPSCENTCRYAFDGECDDGGPGSMYSICDLGTDCNDCGPRGGGYGDSYSDEYGDSYSNSYSNYSDSYYNYYGNSYYNYSDYYDNYYNYYDNYFSNSW